MTKISGFIVVYVAIELLYWDMADGLGFILTTKLICCKAVDFLISCKITVVIFIIKKTYFYKKFFYLDGLKLHPPWKVRYLQNLRYLFDFPETLIVMKFFNLLIRVRKIYTLHVYRYRSIATTQLTQSIQNKHNFNYHNVLSHTFSARLNRCVLIESGIIYWANLVH